MLSLFSLPALSGQVTLKNGDTLTGTIVRKEGAHLLLSTSYAGEIKIQWSEIVSLSADKPLVLVLKNDTSIEEAKLTAITDGKSSVAAKTIEQSFDVALADIKYINPSIEVSGKGTKVSGRVNAGSTLTSGNTESETYNLDAEVVMRSRDNRTTVGATHYRASDNNVDTEDNSSAYLQYDHFLTNKRYIYGNTRFSRDKFADQKLKSTIGLGYGHQFWESDTRNLSVEGGLAFVNEDNYVAADDSYTAARWALDYDQKLYKNKIVFFHKNEGLQSLSDSAESSITSQTGLRFPLLSGMFASIQANIDWEKTPPAGTKSTDRKLLFNLGYAW
jgi:putative salt-induced outer membrane protein YdiY